MSEAVAKWLSSAGLHPDRFIDTRDVEFNDMQLSVDSLNATGTLDEASAIDIPKEDRTNLVPMCVEIGSEAKADATAQSYVLGKVCITEIFSSDLCSS